MNKLKKFIMLNFVLLLASCSTMQSAFQNQKKNNTDEFLVEKKSPLVMPPDFDELPLPKEIEMYLLYLSIYLFIFLWKYLCVSADPSGRVGVLESTSFTTYRR